MFIKFGKTKNGKQRFQCSLWGTVDETENIARLRTMCTPKTVLMTTEANNILTDWEEQSKSSALKQLPEEKMWSPQSSMTNLEEPSNYMTI